MKKHLLLLLSLLGFARWDWAAAATAFPALNRPASILVDDGRIYINDGPVVYIHRADDYSRIAAFGKAGEGPGEFKVHPNLYRGGVVLRCLDDGLMICSLGRVSFFSNSGVFISERKSSLFLGIGQFEPFRDGYVGLGVAGDARQQFMVLGFYDRDFNKRHEFHRLLIFEPGKKIDPVTVGIIPPLYVDGDRIFVLDYEGAVHGFDAAGRHRISIRPSDIQEGYRSVPVTEERREAYLNFFARDPRYQAQFEQDRNRLEFPAVLPECRDFRAQGAKVYLFTFRRRGGAHEMIVSDAEGRLLKEAWIDLRELNPREFAPFAVHEGKLYQLFEDEDDEIWRLHVLDLD